MPFELVVEFSGLCAYLVHPNQQQVAILMPDCRRRFGNPNHPDRRRGHPHVGYMRCDLAALGFGTPAPSTDGDPAYEVVRQFDRQELDFGLPDAPINASVGVPDMTRICPSLTPIPNLFAANPPGVLLFRTVISGGTLIGKTGGKLWGIPETMNAPAGPYQGQFAGFVTWRRTVDADALNVVLRGFDGSSPIGFPLTPVRLPDGKQVISLKIGNLCSHNPLEWRDLDTQMVTEDKDFKWIYHLFEPRPESYDDLLNGAELPFPQTVGPQPFGAEDCMGGQCPACPFP